MKRITFLFIGALFLSIALSSCMKTRICECRSILTPSENENFTTALGSKSKAKSECENYQFSGRNYTPDYTCTLQ
jgi:hypothetical protein